MKARMLEMFLFASLVCDFLFLKAGLFWPELLAASERQQEKERDRKNLRQFLSQLFDLEQDLAGSGEKKGTPGLVEKGAALKAGFLRIVGLLPQSAREGLERKFSHMALLLANNRLDAGGAREFRHAVLKAYEVDSAPALSPQFQLGQLLFARDCASCHGKGGRADGPLADRLARRPSDWRLSDSIRSQSPLMVLNSLVEGSSDGVMPSFAASYSREELQSLSFFVPCLKFSDMAADYRRYWRQMDDQVRKKLEMRGLSYLLLSRATDEELGQWLAPLSEALSKSKAATQMNPIGLLRCGVPFVPGLSRKPLAELSSAGNR